VARLVTMAYGWLPAARTVRADGDLTTLMPSAAGRGPQPRLGPGDAGLCGAGRGRIGPRHAGDPAAARCSSPRPAAKTSRKRPGGEKSFGGAAEGWQHPSSLRGRVRTRRLAGGRIPREPLPTPRMENCSPGTAPARRPWAAVGHQGDPAW